MPVFTHGAANLPDDRYIFDCNNKDLNMDFIRWYSFERWEDISYIPPDEIIPKALVSKSRFKLYDIMYTPFLTVSKLLKSAIEELEPGRHYFSPVRLFFRSSPIDEEYYLLFIKNMLNAAIIEKSSIDYKEVMRPGEYKLMFDQGTSDYRSLDRDVVDGAHLWIDEMFRNYGHLYFSDELYSTYKNDNLTGIPTFYRADFA